MAHVDDVRRALADARLDLDEETIERLAREEEVELRADASDCCPDGWVGIGHKPRWCIKIGNPPKFKLCWG
jgi:hypothetical protein